MLSGGVVSKRGRKSVCVCERERESLTKLFELGHDLWDAPN